MSTALQLFQDLCVIGNALEALRDTSCPASDEWLWHTEVLGMLDASIDLLVHSCGLDEREDDSCGQL
jgi:hypothetical protein